MTPAAPLEALPAWLRATVETVAESTQTDPSMAFGLVLPVLAIAVQAKVEVETEGARVVPLAVWSVIVLESGEATPTSRPR